MSLMQGEVALLPDENEIEKVDDGKRSKVEPTKRSSIWDFDFDEDDYSKEPGYVKQDLTLCEDLA
ncbi:hypothetical protein A2U01_0098938, partial [Trifolium medium]|nr:hypothetical protein [Trifolium medium]